jgi:integrase
MPFNLWQRGHQYYFRIPIPRKLRDQFPSSTGKPKNQIVEPIGSDHESAKVECARRVAQWTEVFARMKTGESLSAIQDTMDGERRAAEINKEIAEINRKAFAEGLASGEIDAEAEKQNALFLASHLAATFERLGLTLPANIAGAVVPAPTATRPAPSIAVEGETVTKAANEWFAKLERAKKVSPQTLQDHRLYVQAFVDRCGDLPLQSVTRRMASEFLTALETEGRKGRTVRKYANSLAAVFRNAKTSGLLDKDADNPFDSHEIIVTKPLSYVPFQVPELQILHDGSPREIRPAKHTPQTALPWIALIATYTGARMEEIAQLKVGDVREVQANGAKIVCFDIHNGDPEHHLKNDNSARLVPVHSQLIRAGLLEYRDALKDQKGPLFPGLVRRASKGGKIGGRMTELFGKKLRTLGIKRDRLSFHSFRHTVSTNLRQHGVTISDVSAVTGHVKEGDDRESKNDTAFKVYAQDGPGLKIVAATVEKISYEGLRIAPAK